MSGLAKAVPFSDIAENCVPCCGLFGSERVCVKLALLRTSSMINTTRAAPKTSSGLPHLCLTYLSTYLLVWGLQLHICLLLMPYVLTYILTYLYTYLYGMYIYIYIYAHAYLRIYKICSYTWLAYLTDALLT